MRGSESAVETDDGVDAVDRAFGDFHSRDKDEVLLNRLQWANAKIDNISTGSQSADTSQQQQQSNERALAINAILSRLEKELIENKSGSVVDAD